jgi:hypothetical protein
METRLILAYSIIALAVVCAALGLYFMSRIRRKTNQINTGHGIHKRHKIPD